MTYPEALDWIHSAKRYPHGNDPARMLDLLARLGNPQKKLRVIHIAGTNGKGSATAMTASVLTRAGYKTGRYVSPYVLEFRERMEIDGRMITEERLTALVERLRPVVQALGEEGRAPAEFEIVTALAFLYFAEEDCDLVCLEVGLGGRFDSTNKIDRALVSVIMAIGYDHTDILGDTLAEIAYEKAGILKEGGTLVLYPELAAEAKEVILREAAARHNRVLIPDLAAIRLLDADPLHQRIDWQGLTIDIPFAGPHQLRNTAVVLAVLELLREQGYTISDTAIAEGIAATRFPARMERLCDHPLVLLDGAHNAQGADALARTLEALGERVHPLAAVVGMVGDKQHDAVLSRVLPLCDRVIVTQAQYIRALDADRLAEHARLFHPDVIVERDQRAALARAEAFAGQDGTVLIFGSLYLAGDIRPLALARWQNAEK